MEDATQGHKPEHFSIRLGARNWDGDLDTISSASSSATPGIPRSFISLSDARERARHVKGIIVTASEKSLNEIPGKVCARLEVPFVSAVRRILIRGSWSKSRYRESQIESGNFERGAKAGAKSSFSERATKASSSLMHTCKSCSVEWFIHCLRSKSISQLFLLLKIISGFLSTSRSLNTKKERASA